jgi:hypothetical protein
MGDKVNYIIHAISRVQKCPIQSVPFLSFPFLS